MQVANDGTGDLLVSSAASSNQRGNRSIGDIVGAGTHCKQRLDDIQVPVCSRCQLLVTKS